ncbi:MAG: NAD-binding protein [Halobacteriovorax sp.]|nr:NAD-binding protein [Halobacteriovorax sp.]|tara:strand:+ start:11300 stop:12280 length:981 start_codon:yes stop_codon:yes gene_type:complete
MKKVLITGGAGFIGFHLAKTLRNSGVEIHILDNLQRGRIDSDFETLLESNNVSFFQKDLLDSSCFSDFDTDYDYIFHFSAIIGVANVLKAPFSVLDKNVKMLSNVLSFSEKNKSLKQFVFPSTSEIYAGTLEKFELEFPTPETTPLAITDLEKPRTSYMLSKIYGEAMVIHSGLPYLIIRPHNFFGPRMGLSHVIPELLKRSYESSDGDSLDVYSMNHTRTFCYIDDAINQILSLLEHEKINDVFNIGIETPEVTIEELAKTVVKITGKDLILNEMPETPGSPRRRCPSIQKVCGKSKKLNFTSLEDGISKTFEWYKANSFSREHL